MRLFRFGLVLLAASSGVLAAQPTPDDFLRESYQTVFAGTAFTYSFTAEMELEDSTVTEAGRVTAFLSIEDEVPRFQIDFEGGETSRAVSDGLAYQVESPRTQRVYVDSTLAEIDSGVVGLLSFHPTLGPWLFYVAQNAASEEVSGRGEVSGAPCTMVLYRVEGDGGAFDLSLCYDDETRLPSLIEYVSDNLRADLRFFDAAAAAVPERFELGLKPGYRRVPYDGSGEPLLAVGDMAPPVAWADAGGSASLADYRGQWVLLDFWGTWCAPCIEAFPRVVQIDETYPDLAVLGLASFEYDDVDPAAFARQRGASYPIVRVGPETVDAYLVRAFPTYYVIDPSGAVAFVAVPDHDEGADDALDAFLAALFAD